MPDSKKGNGQAFGPDGRLYVIATASNQVVVCDTATKESTVLANDIQGNDIVVRRDGTMFAYRAV